METQVGHIYEPALIIWKSLHWKTGLQEGRRSAPDALLCSCKSRLQGLLMTNRISGGFSGGCKLEAQKSVILHWWARRDALRLPFPQPPACLRHSPPPTSPGRSSSQRVKGGSKVLAVLLAKHFRISDHLPPLLLD